MIKNSDLASTRIGNEGIMVNEKTAELKSRLEGMTARELVRMADSFGLDLPPDLDRIFIIRELLDNAEDEGPWEEPLQEKPMTASLLPRYYNITFIEALPRDPRWVFVFWEIKTQDRQRLTGSEIDSYYLKTLELGEKNHESLRVPIGVEDTSWYLAFPADGGSYRVELCAEGMEHPLAVSRPFTLPGLSTGNK
ncbi:MAG: DUF4912 domain-containing protein [Treponema sp.]|jgi:hypothetical protein|nr:DUF4912 domain-containing protein [Treponema sp.]